MNITTISLVMTIAMSQQPKSPAGWTGRLSRVRAMTVPIDRLKEYVSFRYKLPRTLGTDLTLRRVGFLSARRDGPQYDSTGHIDNAVLAEYRSKSGQTVILLEEKGRGRFRPRATPAVSAEGNDMLNRLGPYGLEDAESVGNLDIVFFNDGPSQPLDLAVRCFKRATG